MYRITPDPTNPARVLITCHACRRWSVSIIARDERGRRHAIETHLTECPARVRPEGGEPA